MKKYKMEIVILYRTVERKMKIKKVLFVATVVKTHIMVFHIPYLKWFKENGYETYVCANNDYENKEECVIPYCDHYYDLPFERSPLKLNNLKAYRQLKEIIDSNEFDIIHCHTPVGGVLTRLAARKARKKGTSVIYTAHGFHFYKGAPLKNWIVFYPIERLSLRWTDVLITMNEEDYLSAKKMIKRDICFFKTNGVGVDLQKFIPQTKEIKGQLREEYGYKDSDFILIYAGELSYRKNQDLVIRAVNLLKNKIPNIKLLLAGTGTLLQQYKQLVRTLGLEGNVEFLGYRNDINKLMLLSDIAVSSSRQEGLPVNVMEAMATGLPLVVTDCRGNRDLVRDGENGYVHQLDDFEQFANSINKLYQSRGLIIEFSNNGRRNVEKYSIENVLKEMENIYKKFVV